MAVDFSSGGLINGTIFDASDNTKLLNIDTSSLSSGTTLTLAFTSGGSRTITFPNTSSDSVTLNVAAAVLTNKTITDPSNVVSASRLRTTGTDVVVSTAAPPLAGQVLTGDGSGSALWITPIGGSGITYTFVPSTTSQAQSLTDATIYQFTGMTTTPAAGTYYITFSSSGQSSVTSDVNINYWVQVGATVITDSTREWGDSDNGIYRALYTHTIITVNGSQAVTIRFQRVVGGTFTFTTNQRSMMLLRIS